MTARILECDLGNSVCKWRLRESTQIVDRGFAAYADNFAGLPVAAGFTRARVASVAKADVYAGFTLVIRSAGVEPEEARSQPAAGGVQNGYGEHYASLGVDRWLAVVAAYHQVGGAVLVLDSGSALTADVVDAQGIHLGGYILPGEQLMKLSLLGETARVRFDPAAEAGGLDFGVTTHSAVAAGVFAAQIGAANVAIEQARRRIPAGFAILVTGGGGQRLIPYLSSPANWEPELVLDGLALALP